MKQVELNFASYHSLRELYEALKNAFGLPDYYGANLDALWDCMRDMDEEPMLISIKGISRWLNSEYGEYANKLLQVFENVHKECPEIDFEIID